MSAAFAKWKTATKDSRKQKARELLKQYDFIANTFEASIVLKHAWNTWRDELHARMQENASRDDV